MPDNTPKPGDPYVVLMSRLIVLEGMVSTLLSLYLAAAQNDPTFELAKALLKQIAEDIEFGLQSMPYAVQQEARVFRDALLHRVETQLPGLRAADKSRPH
jgi:hypothetical protein